MITINELELASELAFLKTKEDLLRLGEIKDEDDMYIDRDCEEGYTEDVQDLFNENYDMYYNFIWELKEEVIN